MNRDILTKIRDLIQHDIGNRGLARDPVSNLISATQDDFVSACASIAGTERPVLGVVTGFFIPHADPPAGETDGPLGAVFLARTLVPIGIEVIIITDEFCRTAIEAGLNLAGLLGRVRVVILPERPPTNLTHLIALERVGPSHTPESVGVADAERYRRETSESSWNRCHTMSGRDITDIMQPAHELFVNATIPTIGIGDGGNEIGMGKLPWELIVRNIPNGAKVACRIATDFLIVTGISNWGAYALSAGVSIIRDVPARDIWKIPEEEFLRIMVEAGPLVDGMTARPAISVDGHSPPACFGPLERIREWMR